MGIERGGRAEIRRNKWERRGHTRKSHWASGDFSLVRTVEESHFDFRRLFTGTLRFGAGDAAITSTSPSGFGGGAPPRAVDLVRIFVRLEIGGWNRVPRGCVGAAGWLLVLEVLK